MSTERIEPTRDRMGEPVVRTEELDVRDRVRWGPILAGLLTTITTFLILGLLGVAVGMSVFDEGTEGATIGTGAAIWGILTALISFLAGGWIASWAARQTHETDAIFNGVMVAVAAITVLLLLVGSGVGYLFGAVTANLELISQVGGSMAAGDVETPAGQAALDEARTGTWGTLIGFVAAILAGAVGGWMGRQRDEYEHAPVERRGRASA